MTQTEDLVTALRRVPATRLKIFELARQMVRRGRINVDEAVARALEINEAKTEVDTYAEAIRTLLWRVKRLS